MGVIGLGRMGMLHLRNVRFIEEVSVEAVADRSRKELTKASCLDAKNVFSDFMDMIGHSLLDVDVVAVHDSLYESMTMRLV